MQTPNPDTPIQEQIQTPQRLAEKLAFQGKFYKALEIYQSLLNSQLFILFKNTLEYAQVLDKISFLHYKLCQYTEALDTCHQSFSIKSLRDQTDDIHLVENYKLFGMIYRDQAKFPDSLASLQKCQEITSKHYPENHSKHSDIIYEFGLYYLKLAKFDTAIEYFNSCINILAGCPQDPEASIQIGKSFECLGTIDRYQGHLQNSQANYDKAIEYFLKELSPDHPEIASVNNNLGLLFMDQGEYEKAKEICQKALATRLIYFEKHVDVVRSYFSLARICIKTAKFEDALEYEKRAFEILKDLLGEDHPDIAITYNNTGSILYKQQKPDQALEYFLKAKEILTKVYDEDHPSLAETLNNIGMAYKSQKKYAQALDCYQKSLVIRIKNFGENHTSLAFIYNNIGILLDSEEKYDEALKYYKKSLDIKIRNVGEDHPDVATTYYNMASLLDDKEDFETAMEYYKKCLEIRLKKLDKFHLSIANTYYNMAILSKRLLDYPSAIMYYRASLKAYLVIWGPCHPDVVEAAFRLGMALKTVNQYDEAVSSLKIAYLTQKKCETREDAYFTRQIMNELEVTSSHQQKYSRLSENLF